MSINRLPIILLALALGIFSYQFMLHPTASEQSFKRRFLVGHADIAEDAATPENKTTKKFFQPRLAPLAHLAPSAQPQSLPAEVPAVSPTPMGTPVNIQDLAAATDEKNKDLTKKKKRKKKTVSSAPETKTASGGYFNADVPAQSKEAFAPAPVAQSNSFPTSHNNFNQAAAPTNNNNHNSQSAQYWEDILLKEANPAAVQKFLAMNKAKQVSDDVVYEVASAMIADKRPAIRQLGTVIFGATNSLRNFEALVHIVDSETVNSPTAMDATKYLTTYSNVSNLENMSILSAAIKAPSTTPGLHIEALKLVDAASKQYAVLAFNQTTSPTNGPGIQTYSIDNAHKIFDPFVIILGSLLQSSQDANLKAVASQDISDIQSLIGPQQNASINP